MSATLFEDETTAAPTGYWIFGRLFRAIGRFTMATFGQLGERVLFHRDFFRALLEPKTYLPLMAQRRIRELDHPSIRPTSHTRPSAQPPVRRNHTAVCCQRARAESRPDPQ